MSFAEHGGVGVEELARALGLPLASVQATCHELAAADLLVWRDEAREISAAYPFSGRPTTHWVSIAGRPPVCALCAIDALGIPVMPGQGVAIRSERFSAKGP